ncbi:MAG TPA: PaaX family transcriptional regulator [Bacillales bacterium]|nr:PaaX family transcriptional regulator [Bacillales bacterium]
MLSIEKQILYLLSRVNQMTSSEIISIYDNRKYSSQHIRNVLSKLKKKSLINSPFRSNYIITEKGIAFIKTINQKPILYNIGWNRQWIIVIVEIPESIRKKRELFRQELIQLGFGSLFKSTYFSPWDYSEQVVEIAKSLNIIENISILRGEFLVNGLTNAKINEIWDLESIHQLYLDKLKWFNEVFLPKIDNKSLDDLSLFAFFLELGEIISELNLKDPMLPKELLPTNWQGVEIYRQINEYAQYLISLIPYESRFRKFL